MNFCKKNAAYLMLAASTCVFIISILLNRKYFEALSIRNVGLYQLRQVLSIVCLYLVGYAFMKLIQHRLSNTLVALLAFPSGICLWCFMSQFLLLAEFTYRLWRVLFLIVAFLLLCYGIRRIRKQKLVKYTGSPLKHLCVVLSVALLVSTGFSYIILNYDSYFYFADYGKSLPLLMSYRDIVTDNSFVLTNIGQFLPLVSSYITYWKLDTMLPIHSFMILNLLALYGYGIYLYAKRKAAPKRASYYTALFVVLLGSCTPFFLFTNWILSNSWITFYLFFLFFICFTNTLEEDESTGILGVDTALLVCGYSLAITMLRKDGFVIVCFFFLCLSIRLMKLHSYAKQSLIPALLLAPSTLYLFYYIYYLKNVIYAQTVLAIGNSLINEKHIKLLVLIALMTYAYLFLLRIPMEKLCKEKLPLILTILMLLALGGLCVKNRTRFIDYSDAWVRNLLGTGFGYALLGILLLVVLCLIAKNKYDISSFVVFGFIILILLVYINKDNKESNIDNSGLRAIYQIIPIFYFVCAQKLTSFLKEK